MERVRQLVNGSNESGHGLTETYTGDDDNIPTTRNVREQTPYDGPSFTQENGVMDDWFGRRKGTRRHWRSGYGCLHDTNWPLMRSIWFKF